MCVGFKDEDVHVGKDVSRDDEGRKEGDRLNEEEGQGERERGERNKDKKLTPVERLSWYVDKRIRYYNATQKSL